MEWGKFFEIVWFDSLGAKSASVLLHGEGCDILVDPGAAAMQPSYPLPEDHKKRLREQALRKIASLMRSSRVRVIIITHYHYDHHPRPGDPLLPLELFKGKTILAKNPNEYINESQWRRARLFFESLAKIIGVERVLVEPESKEYVDPVMSLQLALSKKFPGYDDRRRELISKGREWFRRLTRLWIRGPWIAEVKDGVETVWADGRKIQACGIEIEFTPPWFHGVEYDRTGWVIGFQARRANISLFYTSDVMGPIIEDYAEEIAKNRPDIVVLDGPPTYLYPYMLNRINLERAIENAITIIDSEPKLIIYDHHLLREKRWRERVRPVIEHAARRGVALLTAAEYLGKKPLIDTL